MGKELKHNVDYSREYIDWWHEALLPNEDFAHNGLLKSHVLNPALTIGLSDYFNLTAFDNIGLVTFDDPLHIVGDIGYVGYDFGHDHGGFHAETSNLSSNKISHILIKVHLALLVLA